MLTTLLQFIHVTSLVCWVGAIVFFSFFAAPAIFKTLDRTLAGEVVGVIFPRYYLIGYVCGALALITLLLAAAKISVLKLAALVVMIACTGYAGGVVSPKARKLKAAMRSVTREEDKQENEAAFKKLHGLSVQLNGAVLLFGLWLLWLTASGLTL